MTKACRPPGTEAQRDESQDAASMMRARGGRTSSDSSPFFLPFLPGTPAGPWWMRMCLVSSSDLENFLSQPGWLHACGFSPVCVRM